MTTTEEYFKALGWERIVWKEVDTRTYYTWFDSKKEEQIELPDIIDHYPSFKKHVLEVMEGEGFAFELNTQARRCVWYLTGMIPVEEFQEPILNNNILRAAVIAATRYWESKK